MSVQQLVFPAIAAGLILGAGVIGCGQSERGVPVTRTDRQRETFASVAAPEAPRPRDRSDSPMRADDQWAGRTSEVGSSPTGMTTGAEQRDAVTTVAPQAPPLTPAETPAHEPRAGEFWVAGIWRWDALAFAWHPGRIERDRPGQLYVPAGWVTADRGWEFTPEFWR